MLALLLTNRRIIAEISGIIAVLALVWWFGIRNPATIRQLQADNATLRQQVASAHAAVNTLIAIGVRHDLITRTSYRNISTIRYAPRPARNGIFLPGGVLPTVPDPADTLH